MSYQEKKNIVALATTLLVFGSYSLYMYIRFNDANLEGAELFRFWGAFILILIPVSIVARIIIEVGFIVVNRITTKEVEPSFADELDKLILLKAMRTSFFVFVFGFLLAMGSLVLNMAISTMFIILILSGFLSEVAGNISQLYYYRRGV